MNTGDPFELDDVVRRYEDWYATPFGAHADAVELELITEMLAPLHAGATLLEIGCGTAHFGAALASRGFHVTGVEPSERMLRVASQRISVVRGAAERLPFRDRSFDGALVVAVLDFVEDPVRVLAEARRVARQRVAVLALAKHSWLASLRRLAALRGHPIFGSARFYSQRTLLEFARAGGAEPERLRGALPLPPSWAGRFPSLDRRLARVARPVCGLIAFSLDARNAHS